MGKNKDEDKPTQVRERAVRAYEQSQQPSATEQEFTPISQGMFNNYNQAVQQNTQDYGNIMGGYQNWRNDLSGFQNELDNMSPTRFSFERVNAPRPGELNESYGYLREAAPGYREFAQTGGYSPQDIQELRARGISPIRAAYGNTMREIDRARRLGGGGSNYIAARSRAQRELPQQIADATTTVNANLADAIRQGKLAGLAGITGIGSTMGGLSSAEAGRQLQAALANQSADLQTQGMNQQALQQSIANRMGVRGMGLQGLSGMSSLYGTTPGMASTFGNQALNAYNTRASMEANRMNYGLGLLDTQLRSYGAEGQDRPWWQTALGIAGTAAPYIGMAFSDKNMKEDIEEPKKSEQKVISGLKKLNLHKWKYKGDKTTHFGPMAQEFKRLFGVGDGKTLHPADVFGVALTAAKGAVS